MSLNDVAVRPARPVAWHSSCIYPDAMKNIILCSSNPILVKSLYATLRDEGFVVATSEHPAFAVQMIMQGSYDFLIIDSEPFGLSAEDAVTIAKKLRPELQVLFVEEYRKQNNDSALDLEEFKKTIQSIAV